MNIRVFPLTPRLRPCALACAAACLSLGAVAQEGVTAGQGTAQVVVTGSVRERVAAEVPYAIGVVGREELRAAGPMINLSEGLARVPGLIVNNRNNYAQDLQISSRGFGSRATFGVRGLRLYSDGIPATMPDGQGQVSHFDLAGASRIEVLRGPFSVLYGNSSGGVIALFSAPVRERQGEVALDVGSDGLRQLRGSVETPLGGGFDLRLSGATMEYDGFRPQMEAKRHTFNARLGWQGEADRVVVQAGYFSQPAQDPLGLTRPEFNANPYGTTLGKVRNRDADSAVVPVAQVFNTRKEAEQTQAGASWQHRFGEGALRESQVAAYTGRRSVTQWQSIPLDSQTPASHSGGVVDFDRDYHGVDARLRWGWDNVDLLTGVAYETQGDDRRGFENFTGTVAAPVLGVTGRQRRDERNTATTRDAYAQLDWTLTSAVTASAGVRSGEVRLKTRDAYLSNGDDSGALAFNYTNPVLGLRWQALPTLQLHASAARGFESPTLTELAYRLNGQGAGFNTALQPQTSRQFELGAKWREGAWGVDAAMFRANVDNEIGIASNTGGRASYQNVGHTRRQGAELSTSFQPASAWRAQLGLTYLDATYRDAFTTCTGTPCDPATGQNTALVLAGNRIAGTQRTSAFGEVAWRDAGLGEVALEARALGRTAVNDRNSDFAPGYVITNLRWIKSWPLAGGRKVELLARVDNLADKVYAGSVIVNEGNARFFETGAPRSFLLGLRVYGGF